MRKMIVFLLFLFCVYALQAQKTIVLEKLRCFSATGMATVYLKDDVIRKTIASQLNKTLLQFQHASLTDTVTLANIEYVNIMDLVSVDISFTDTDTSRLHLYIDLFEIMPASFFSFPGNAPSDTTVLQRARSVFLFRGSLVRSDKTIVFSEQLDVVVCAAETGGMGILFQYHSGDGRLKRIVATPRAFTEMIKAATNILFNPANQTEMVEMKVSPAFIADNYILPNTINRPRTYVVTNKNISTYHYADKGEMIRLGEPVYEQILLKGKKSLKYPDDITAAIKNTTHYSSSDFVFLRQECRDVIRDKNYLLKLTTQVDPDNMLRPPLTFTNFLTGKFHYLFLENDTQKDTIAQFTIQKNISGKDKKIYVNRVSNGNDTSFYKLNAPNLQVSVLYDYIAEGTIGNRNFSIKCSGFTNTVKEIFLDDKLVCIAQGRFRPEKFVVFDASLSPELLNPLFMIGFNRFFE